MNTIRFTQDTSGSHFLQEYDGNGRITNELKIHMPTLMKNPAQAVELLNGLGNLLKSAGCYLPR